MPDPPKSISVSSLKSPKQTKARAKTKKTKPANYAALKTLAAENQKKHGKSKNTTDNYDGHIRRGKEFVAKFSKDEAITEAEWQHGSIHRMSGDGEDSEIAGQDELDPEFPFAFTGPPKKCTPLAISMFMASKCFEENRGKSTAVAIHAAFLLYYKQM
jgi:hypothetical protein